MTRIVVTIKRKPVPAEWRDEHHWLNIHSRRSYAAQRGGGHYSRSGGTCSCGEKFGLDADDHTCDYAEVLDQWKDHVAQAFHGEDYYTRKEVEV